MIAALRSAIEKIPTREERLGGQTFKYVKLSEVLDLLDTFRNAHEPCEQLCPHGMRLADNVCGPCSKGEPNRRTDVVLRRGASESDVRPLSEWHEDDGPAVWWKFPVEEAAWIGGPNDSDWPGYHTHWTPHPTEPTLRAQGALRGVGSEPCEIQK